MTKTCPSRRDVLKYGAGAFALSAFSSKSWSDTNNPEQLIAAPSDIMLDEDVGSETTLWAFNHSSPGPTLRVHQYDNVDIELVNRLPEATAIHWHGIRIDNKMDGAVGLTQPPVASNDRFRYKFEAPDAGTYWYHAHLRSFEQVARGLYGILIVDEPDPPQIDQEFLFVVDDWRLDKNGQIVENFGNLHDIAHAGRIGNWLTVNGKGFETYAVQERQRLRVRMVNVANSLIMPLGLNNLNATVMAVDGMPVQPFSLSDNTLSLSPGQRIDLLIDIYNTDANIVFLDRQGELPLAKFKVEPSTVSSHIQSSPVVALSPNPISIPNRNQAVRKIVITMEGGAMGAMQSAIYKNNELQIKQLVEHGMAWSLNGHAGMTEDPLFRAKQGETVQLNIVNNTRWPHAMHTHGHHFLTRNKLNPDAEAFLMRDTALVDPRETLSVHLKADNPGRWLLHCHMLEHQAGGMVTWFEVN